MRRSRSLLLLAVVLSVLTALACSTDPEVRKQRFVESGDGYLAEGRLAEAIIEYRNAVQIDPAFGVARKQLGVAYERNGDAALAFQEFVRAADLLPDDIDIQITAGSYLVAAGRAEDALGRAEVALELQPDHIPAYVLRGNALAGLRSFDEAIEAIEEAIRLDPERGATFAQLGNVELLRGREAEAEAAFKRAIALSPDTVDAHLALGNFYWSFDRPNEAEQAFRGALDLQPDNDLANRAMAALMVAINRSADAEPFLRRLADASTDTGPLFALADYYLSSNRPKEAIARLEAARKGGQDTPDVTAQLARAYAASGDRATARALVEGVLAGNPALIDAQLVKGQLLLDEGDSEEALATLRSATTANPASAEAQFVLGRLYASRGDNAAAEAAFREVLRLNPRATAAQLEIARLQIAAGNTTESVRTAEAATQNQPGDIAARLTLVRSLIAAKDVARAKRELAALQSEQPNLPAVHVQAGQLALLENDVPGARRAFERAQSLDAASFEALAGLVALDLRTRDFAAARARVEKQIAQGSTYALQMLASQIQLAADDPTAAERSLRAAIEAAPSNLQPYYQLGRLYVGQRRLAQARAEFEAMASRQTQPIGALTMVGILYESEGNVAAARQQYEQVLALDSRAAVAANNLAWILGDSGEDLDRAQTLAQTATAASPDVPEIMDTLGWVYYKKNQPQLAIPLFERCVERAPEVAAYRYHLGLALVQAGDPDKGKAELKRALAAGPGADIAADIRRILADDAGGTAPPN